MDTNDKFKPPIWASRLLETLVPAAMTEELLGDLSEAYQNRVKRRGRLLAKMIHWFDVFHLLFGFGAFNLFRNHSTIMYRHYLTLVLRNITRDKSFSAIKILGLTAGIAVCLIICQYVYFENSFDNFHRNANTTYRLLFDKTKNGLYIGADPYNGYRLGESIAAQISEVQKCTRVYPAEYGAVFSPDDRDIFIVEDPKDMLFVDKNFFEVFNFEFAQGNAGTALDHAFNIVVTLPTAKKYFGNDDPIGKTIRISGGSSPGIYTVTGVLQELPHNSHMQFEFLMPLDNFWELGNGGSVNRYDGWARIWFVTYIVVEDSSRLDLIAKKLDLLIAEHKAKWNNPENIVEKTRFQLLSEIHLSAESYASADFVRNRGRRDNVTLFSFAAFFILFIAYANYINLSTARALKRAKEVGIRKTIGAFRRQLIVQFMLETLIVNLIAMVLALGLAAVAAPLLSKIIGTHLQWTLFQLSVFWILVLGIIAVGTLFSGLYPAFILSAFKPINALGKQAIAARKSITLRKGLIGFQLLISLLFITSTYLVYKQIMFMKNAELGMTLQKVVVLRGPTTIENAPEVTDGTDISQIRAVQSYNQKVFEAFKTEALSHHTVESVNGAGAVPGQIHNLIRHDIRKIDEPASAGSPGIRLPVDLDYIETYGLHLIAGTDFDSDMSRDEFVIINEEACHKYGLGSPVEAVGTSLLWGNTSVTIAGVVKNFHWQSLRDNHIPIVLHLVNGMFRNISCKISTNNVSESIAHIESVYKEIYPGNAFEYVFLDDEFNNQYRADLQFGKLFLAFTMLAIFIACLGLFALVSHLVITRLKEIGVRKILGASTTDLMLLLSREFLQLVGIAFITAIPVVFIFGRSWLNRYAFSINMSPDLILIPGLMLLIIAILTVSRVTYFAAISNPVNSLK